MLSHSGVCDFVYPNRFRQIKIHNLFILMGFLNIVDERNEKSDENFPIRFVVGLVWFPRPFLLNDGSLCTHNPIHSFALSGHFTKSEKKKIDCPEKTGYRLDVQYAELCKMATAEMELLLTFFLFSSKPFDAPYSGACLLHRFAYQSNAYMHTRTHTLHRLDTGARMCAVYMYAYHSHSEKEKPERGTQSQSPTHLHRHTEYTPSV